MLPDVFGLLASWPAVTALCGSPPRVYRHGDAGQSPLAPYVTWYPLVVNPEIVLDGPPPADRNEIQFDCYSTEKDIAEALAKAVRDALEATNNPVTSISAHRKDPNTNNFRFSLIATIWADR